jgi:hypothetical protein
MTIVARLKTLLMRDSSSQSIHLQSTDGSKNENNKETSPQLSDGKKENQMTTVLEFLSTISTLVPVIKEMMTSIEAEMGAGTGADKKAAVISGIQGIVGDSSNWAHLQTILSVIIDFLAKKYFGSKV